MLFNIITKLEQSGELKCLIRAGALASTTPRYYDIYMDYDRNRKLGMGVMDAIYKTCETMKSSESVVNRARRMMEKA